MRLAVALGVFASSMVPWGLCALTHASGASPTEMARLAARLPPAVAATVVEIVGEARAKGVPTEPLVATALEGVARGANPDRIINAVRTQAATLEIAKRVLDPASTEAEIVAGASAIRARVPADSLIRLRTVRRGSMVIPLVVMADMVARGVPAGTASGAVIAASRAGMRDAELLRLREHIAQDIGAGVLPGEAARIRTQASILGMEGPLQIPPARR